MKCDDLWNYRTPCPRTILERISRKKSRWNTLVYRSWERQIKNIYTLGEFRSSLQRIPLTLPSNRNICPLQWDYCKLETGILHISSGHWNRLALASWRMPKSTSLSSGAMFCAYIIWVKTHEFIKYIFIQKILTTDIKTHSRRETIIHNTWWLLDNNNT